MIIGIGLIFAIGCGQNTDLDNVHPNTTLFQYQQTTRIFDKISRSRSDKPTGFRGEITYIEKHWVVVQTCPPIPDLCTREKILVEKGEWDRWFIGDYVFDMELTTK